MAADLHDLDASGAHGALHRTTDADPARWLGLTVFVWIQVLLVLGLALTEDVRFGVGADIYPFSAPREWAGIEPGNVLRLALYAVTALLMSRQLPLWQRPWQKVPLYLGVLLLLHAGTALPGVLTAPPGYALLEGWVFFGRGTLEFGLLTAFAHAMNYAERQQVHEQEDLRLRAELAESAAERMRAHIRRLNMEWTPAFLTGTLDAIGRLLEHDDVESAKRLLIRFSTALRRLLMHLRSDAIRVEQEIELARDVLAVATLRRPGITVEWAIDDDALDLSIAPMSLTGLVHAALAECADDCRVQIRISTVGDGTAATVHVAVADCSVAAAAYPAVGGADVQASEFQGAVPAVASSAARATGEAAAPDRNATGRLSDAVLVPAGHRWLGVGTYTVLIVLCAVQALYTANLQIAQGTIVLAAPSWVYIGGSGLYAALWWGSLVLVAHHVANRVSRKGPAAWLRVMGVHGAGVLGVSVLNMVLYFPFQSHAVTGGAVTVGIFSPGEWGDLAAYFPLAAIAHAFDYARRQRAQRVAELQLRSQLSRSRIDRAEAEIQALRAELNPHFLFNALNTVSSLMHTRVDMAQRVVSQLSLLLRRVLEGSHVKDVSVAEEFEFLRLYLQIEQTRFCEALQVEFRAEPLVLVARVPHMLLQPLVENAVKHGVRARGGNGSITISALRRGDRLELSVVDDGEGPGRPADNGAGIGLLHVRERLVQCFHSDFDFELARTPNGCTAALIRIPFSTVEA
jgi:two-component system, LytTR family, sensor kinase